MECMGQEPVLFEDILCQMIDMIKPEVFLFVFIPLIVWFVVGKVIIFPENLLLPLFSPFLPLISLIILLLILVLRVFPFLFLLLFLFFFSHTHTQMLQNESYITLRDLKGSKLSGSVFNILFNLNKFMAFETRDPFLIRQVHEKHPVIFESSRIVMSP